MSFIDKLKNVFFEEVEDDEEEEEVPQTFAKKVEIPKKKVNVVRQEKEEKIKEKDLDKFLEEEEVKKEDASNNIDNFIEIEEPEPPKVVPMLYDEDDFQEDNNLFETKEEPISTVYKREEINEPLNRELYSGKRETYADGLKNRSYTYTRENYYEEKEKKVFKPSPIISPIYGILDKNYRKEEVITKRETRISTGFSSKPDLDSVRNKAFKDTQDKKTAPQKKETVDDKKKVYDVNNSKPHVNKVTLADAEEYYNDLGLAYNVDYSDASRNTESKNTRYSRDKRKEKKDVDDNLFDLIDSMYSKED